MHSKPIDISPSTNPIEHFIQWYNYAKSYSKMPDPGAMCLSTIDSNGCPNARIVLLKEITEEEFVFYTNLNSVKGQELLKSPHAALTFYWPNLYRQVRVQGQVQQVSDQEADRYFRTRPRGSQISAHASKQSSILHNPRDFDDAIELYKTQFSEKPVPRPKHWSGFRIIPETMEFWQAGDSRRHERWRFVRQGTGWETSRLYP